MLFYNIDEDFPLEVLFNHKEETVILQCQSKYGSVLLTILEKLKAGTFTHLVLITQGIAPTEPLLELLNLDCFANVSALFQWQISTGELRKVEFYKAPLQGPATDSLKALLAEIQERQTKTKWPTHPLPLGIV